MSARKTFAALSLAVIMRGGCGSAAAQEFRGTIEGTVTDSTGGVLPGVTVTVTNTATAVEQNVVTDESGRYPRPLSQSRQLLASPPSCPASRSSSACDNEVRVGDVVRVDVVLEAGGVSETVSVTAERSLLNTSSGISGTTVDSKQIAELPLGDGTAYMLTRLAPGIMDTSDLHFARPADNGNLAGIVDQRRAGRQRVHHRRLAEHVERARRRASRRRRTRSSSSRCRPTRSMRRAGHTAGAVVNLAREERDQLAAPGDQLLQSRRQPRGDAAADRSATTARSRRASTTATPAR